MPWAVCVSEDEHLIDIGRATLSAHRAVIEDRKLVIGAVYSISIWSSALRLPIILKVWFSRRKARSEHSLNVLLA